MDSHFIDDLRYWVNAILSPTSIILNTILLVLIIFKSSKNLESYKKVLYLGWFADASLSFWFIVAQPDITNYGPIYFMFTRGLLGYLPFPWSAWSFPITIFLVYLSVVNLPVQFIYRYLMFCWNIELSAVMFTGLLSVALSSISAYCYYVFYYLITRTEGDKVWGYLLNGTEFENVPYFGAFPMTSLAGGFYIGIAITTVSYIIVFICGFEIIRKFLSIDGANKDYQRQITIVMTFEAVSSFATTGFSIFFDIITSLMGVHFWWAKKIAYLLGTLSPVLNPIVKMAVISSYRRTILQFLGLKKKPLFKKNISQSAQGGLFTTSTS